MRRNGFCPGFRPGFTGCNHVHVHGEDHLKERLLWSPAYPVKELSLLVSAYGRQLRPALDTEFLWFEPVVRGLGGLKEVTGSHTQHLF